MEVLLGHGTWLVLLRREVLAMLGSVYAFIKVAGATSIPLWPSVFRELSQLMSILPLLVVDLSAPWWPVVSCSDASPFGIGMCERELPIDVVGGIGRQNEKWRFQRAESTKAREHAFGELRIRTSSTTWTSSRSTLGTTVKLLELPAIFLKFLINF